MDEFINQVITGNALELAADLAPQSFDLIFTDPEYTKLEHYQWLGGPAATLLKDDKAALVWQRNDLILAGGNALVSEGLLSYRALFSWYQANNMRIYGPIYNKWVPLFWMERGRSKPYRRVQDLRKVSLSVGRNRQDRFHKWSKRTELVSYYLEAFTKPGDLVFDPFTGGGGVPYCCELLGRRYVAFELDEAKAEVAVKRAELGRLRREEMLCAA